MAKTLRSNTVGLRATMIASPRWRPIWCTVKWLAATGGEPSPQVVKAATRTIPIVFMANGDPIAPGLLASLNQPGGNATGVTIFGMMAVGKRLELLRQLMPKAGIIAYLTNPNNPNREIDNVQTAARSLGQQILVLNANSDREFDAAFATIAQ